MVWHLRQVLFLLFITILLVYLSSKIFDKRYVLFSIFSGVLGQGLDSVWSLYCTQGHVMEVFNHSLYAVWLETFIVIWEPSYTA